ncbi:MAG: translation initiation factor IF-2 [Nitrospirae bacterium]|nr:translation initiation factor IF-2 [Nitrospirota bacterium]
MSGKKVFELAREFNMKSKELLDILKSLGIAASTHMSVLDESSIALVSAKLNKTADGIGKANESFKEIKGTPKTILIKKKAAAPLPEEILPAAPVEEAAKSTEKKGSQELKEDDKKLEENVIRKLKEFRELGVLKEDFQAGQTVSAPGEQVVAADVNPLPEIKESLAQPAEDIPIAEETPVIVKPEEEKTDIKGQKKKGIKVIAGEVDEDLVISQKWKGFKVIPKKVKKFKSAATDRRAKGSLQADITKPRKKIIKLYEGITVKEFADLIGHKSNEVIARLIEMGMMVPVNNPIDVDAAVLIADAFGLKVEIAAEKKLEEYIEEVEDVPETLQARAPVVTIMGHVDHGKTSLLDAIRKTRVTEGEAGGITQHIGAYVVETNGKKIVFLDTPGHEAFTAMRARGAKVTDIVILVVAADDGIMPQTIEAINHARAANVPIIVAINKIDKPGSSPERIRQELTKHGLVPEEWGGQNIVAEVSAKQKTGLDHLLEMILLQAEVLELKANPDKKARGVILEAKLDKGRGPVATVLVQNGTLKQGDPFVCGTFFGRVRLLLNDVGKPLQIAYPSTPVEVIGLSGVPQAGDTFVVAEDEQIARSIATDRQQKQRVAGLEKAKKVTLDELYSQIKDGVVRELKIIIKGDVQGSVEAVNEALERLGTDAVKVRVIHGGVGGITETDVMLAAASNAIIAGFNVRPEPKAVTLAEKEKVDIRLYNIIYDAVADVKAAMEGLLEPTLKEHIKGRAEVREVFTIPKIGSIAGSYILDGVISRSTTGVRLIRDNVEIYKGKISSLRRFKDDVREVQAGYECGIGIENFNDIKVGDIIEAYVIEKIAGKL